MMNSFMAPSLFFGEIHVAQLLVTPPRSYYRWILHKLKYLSNKKSLMSTKFCSAGLN